MARSFKIEEMESNDEEIKNKLLQLFSMVMLVNNRVRLQEIHDEEYHFQLE